MSIVSCSSQQKAVSSEDFSLVEMGISEKELVEQMGKPVRIHQKEDCEEYEYIERFYMGDRLVRTNHYFFLLENGKVIDKNMKSTEPPTYELNSYELQSSQL
ncbi:MAG: hypothetical protein JW769_00230 [Parachlamydiales bacterium]|nr:hypothetical protein [Parachlamydiales bacterium]